MAEALDLSSFVRRRDDGAAWMDFAVEGIVRCGSIRAIEAALCKLAGLTKARVNFSARRLHVEWTAGVFDPARIVADLAALGYRAHPFAPQAREEDLEAAQARWLLRCLAVAAFAAMNIMLLSVSVWAGNVERHHAGDARFLSLALRPHRAAGGGLCRAAVFPQRDPCDQGAIAQHGRADFPWRPARPDHVGRRDRTATPSTPISTARSCCSSFCSPGRYLDQAMRRKTRAYAANLSALRAPVAARSRGQRRNLDGPAPPP